MALLSVCAVLRAFKSAVYFDHPRRLTGCVGVIVWWVGTVETCGREMNEERGLRAT